MTGVSIILPGVALHEYYDMLDKMYGPNSTPEDIPVELVSSVVGTSDGDLYVFQMWKAKRYFEQFWHEQIEPARIKLGIDTDPFVQFFTIEDAMFPAPDMIDEIEDELEDASPENNQHNGSDEHKSDKPHNEKPGSVEVNTTE